MGILSIRCPDEEFRPVAFYSHTLTAPELNYDTLSHPETSLTHPAQFRTPMIKSRIPGLGLYLRRFLFHRTFQTPYFLSQTFRIPVPDFHIPVPDFRIPISAIS
ncbi:hypothetical protein BS17DRAFT_779402 [Gyrodon lividus]|nr:hypothetical protein BS17DRAFT_779402 [Gyrodon lividus]